MSKLLKLKKWLTIDEAAKYLGSALSEAITEADIFRLSLDGALTLSVYFLSSVNVKLGRPIPLADAEKLPGIPVEGREPYKVVVGIPLGESKVLIFDEQISTVSGSVVLDLPMVGGERISCEERYQRLTKGPYVELGNICGTFLHQPNTERYVQICESYMPKQKEGDSRNEWERRGDLVWYPIEKLPEDAVFVVRVESLTKMLSSLLNDTSTEKPVEKPLEKRERDTLLTIIAVLCKEAKLDYKTAAKSAGLIQSTAASMGVSIGETTVEGHLKKIPDALAGRMK